MGVTHVIRGQEHLSNAGRQILLYQAMSWPTPVFAHLPLILGQDGAKLSKRHGAQSVSDFRRMGYLPETMRNYLARLGWGHAGDDELFTDEQAIALVRPRRRSQSCDARFGHFDETEPLQPALYIRLADDDRLTELVAGALVQRDVVLPDDHSARLRRALPFVKDGAKTIQELADLVIFALRSPNWPLDEKTRGLLDADMIARLDRLTHALSEEEDWSRECLLARLRQFAGSEGGFGSFGPALRGILAAGARWLPDLAGRPGCAGEKPGAWGALSTHFRKCGKTL